MIPITIFLQKEKLTFKTDLLYSVLTSMINKDCNVSCEKTT
jgi:hypothetical protein